MLINCWIVHETLVYGLFQNIPTTGAGMKPMQGVSGSLTPKERRNGNCVQYFEKVYIGKSLHLKILLSVICMNKIC